MNLRQTNQVIKTWIEDLQNTENGYWLRAYDEAISLSLGDMMTYDSDRVKELISEYFPDIIEPDYEDFEEYLINRCEFKARAWSHYAQYPGFSLYYGQAQEEELQLDEIAKYPKSIAILNDVTVTSSDTLVYYTGNSIYAELSENHDDVLSAFKEQQNRERIELLLCDSRGVYIPRDFLEFDLDKWHIKLSEEDIAELQNPCNEWYWECWQSILDNAYYIDDKGDKWTLWQDGDLFAVKDGYYYD